MKINKKILLAALSSCLVAGSAQADIMATAFISMTNFTLQDHATGNPLDAVSDFSQLSYTSSADQDVAFDSLSGQDSQTGGVGGIDFAPRCLGDNCNPLVDNVFPTISQANAGGNYAAADQVESGAPVDNLAGFDPVAGAAIGNGSYVAMVSGTHAGSANSNNNLNASWTFTLAGGDRAIDFDFDVRSYQEVYVTADELGPGSAQAATSFNITITEQDTGNVVFQLAPDLFNQTISLNAPLPIDITVTGTGYTIGNEYNDHLTVTTPLLTAGQTYQLSARINTNVDGSRFEAVPEPSLALLLGGGLLGMGAWHRRRRGSR